MRLSELLDELRTNILNDRSDRTAGTSDYLWTDATLVRYINEAQRRFATKSLVLRDATTPEVTRVTLLEGVSEYTLHPSVIAVVSAKRSTDAYDLSRAGHSMLDTFRPPEWFVDPATFNGLSAGPPVAFSTDEGVVEDDEGTLSAISMRVYPAPSAAEVGDIINLRVVRKPIETLHVGAGSMVPEIPEEHHLDMLDWAAYLALRINDDDAGNPRRAMEFRASFDDSVKEARKLVMRKLFTPTTMGVGRLGFSWGR